MAKWKEEVTTYFDDEKDGMEGVMDEFVLLDTPATKEFLETACLRSHTNVSE